MEPTPVPPRLADVPAEPPPPDAIAALTDASPASEHVLHAEPSPHSDGAEHTDHGDAASDRRAVERAARSFSARVVKTSGPRYLPITAHRLMDELNGGAFDLDHVVRIVESDALLAS